MKVKRYLIIIVKIILIILKIILRIVKIITSAILNFKFLFRQFKVWLTHNYIVAPNPLNNIQCME